MITNMIMRGASNANARGPHGSSRFDESPRSRANHDHASRTYFNEPPVRHVRAKTILRRCRHASVPNRLHRAVESTNPSLMPDGRHGAVWGAGTW
jgi:hypothetical protein